MMDKSPPSPSKEGPSKRAFSWPLTVLAVLMVALMFSLGVWQLGRADQSRERRATYEQAQPVRNVELVTPPPRYSLVEVTGRYDASRQVVMDGFSRNKTAGFQVLTPFTVEGTDTVLMVNRGWRFWGGQRDNIADMEVSAERRTLRGRAERFWQPGMILGDGNATERADWPRIVVYPQHDEITRWMQQPVAVWQLLLDPQDASGFVREWSPGGLPPERHVGYAMQWFALAITLIVLYFIIVFKRRNPSEE